MNEQRSTAKLRAFMDNLLENATSSQSNDEYWLDFLVQDSVVAEIRNAAPFDPVYEAQALTYLKITGKKISLLTNFYSRLVRDGLRRFIL